MNITGRTKITGVIGYPVKHSLSPIFQNASIKYLNLEYIYLPLEVRPENLEKVITSIRVLNFRGVNVTIPHKKQVLNYIDEITEESKILGVVNTITKKGNLLKGDITDGAGFIRSLKNDGSFNPKNRNVLVLGAGGSSYAISGSLVKEGIKKLFISNRTYEKSVLLKKHLLEKLNFKNVEIIPFEERNEKEVWQETELLVNTTSMGMENNDILLVKEENLTNLKFVYDIVYNRKTELLKTSSKLKIPYLNGISMLIYQGAISFEVWTGKKAPLEIMKSSLKNFTLKK